MSVAAWVFARAREGESQPIMAIATLPYPVPSTELREEPLREHTDPATA